MLTEKWQKSSISNVDNCVEARIVDDYVEVRNSKSPQTSVAFSRNEWEAFIPVAADEFKIQ